MQRREPAQEATNSTSGIECWEEADATSFMVRGLNYARTKKKEACAGAFYRCVALHRASHFWLNLGPEFMPCWAPLF